MYFIVATVTSFIFVGILSLLNAPWELALVLMIPFVWLYSKWAATHMENKLRRKFGYTERKFWG